MKKITAALLITVMLVSQYGAVLADKLKLPSEVETIEADAFYGDRDLDVVEIPYGAESIGSRAFAQSGVRLAIIPDSVTYIAPDAFSGTNVKIRCSENSYAHDWAVENGFALDEGEISEEEALAEMEELAQDALTSEVLYSQTGELLSVEDITDSGILADIAGINALIEAGNALAEESREMANMLQMTAASFASGLPILEAETDASCVRLSFAGAAVTVDRAIADAAERGVEIDGVTASDDSAVTALNASDGSTWYMYESGGSCFVTLAVPSVNGIPAARGIMADFIDQIEFAVNRVLNLADAINDQVQVMLEKTQAEADNLKTQMSLFRVKSDDYRRACAGMDTSHDPYYQQLLREAKQYDAKWEVCNRWLKDVNKRLGLLKKFNMALKKLPFVSLAVTAAQVIAYWRELMEIGGHRHPTQNDVCAQAPQVIRRMNNEIAAAKSYMLLNIASTLAGIAASMVMVAAAVPTAGASVAPLLIVNGIFIALDVILEGRVDGTMKKVRADHAMLHTSLYGWVKDYDRGTPLQNVRVTDGDVTVYTDANGYYEWYRMPGSVHLNYTKDGYQEKTVSATLTSGEAKQVPDVCMMMDSGTLYGYIYDEDTREALSGVKVTDGTVSVFTDERGYYEIELPTGTVRVTYSKDGYKEKNPDIQVPLDQRIQRDVLLEKEAVMMTVYGNVYEKGTNIRLSGVSVSCGDYAATSGSNGYYAISLPNEPCVLTFSKTDYPDYTYTISQNKWESFRLDVYLVAPTHFVVYGTVTNGRSNGAPLSGVLIYTSVTGDEIVAMTDGNGQYEIMLPRGEGNINIYFLLDGFQEGLRTVSGTTMGYYQLDDKLWEMRHAHGRVFDSQTHAPLAGVRVASGGYETYTDGEGYYYLNFVQENIGTVTPFTLTFSKAGYSDSRVTDYIYFNAVDLPMDDVHLSRK